MEDDGQVQKTPVREWRDGAANSRMDSVVTEEPLSISIIEGGLRSNLGVVMRTPGDDHHLVLGWLCGEGLSFSIEEILVEFPDMNIAEVSNLGSESMLGKIESRKTTTGSSCGLCGRHSIEDLLLPDLSGLGEKGGMNPEMIRSLSGKMSEAQPAFKETGGIHAAFLFDKGGELVCSKEDVGRHNAVDKIVGWTLEIGRDCSKDVLLLSGRVGFDLAVKSAFAGIPTVVALGAPSSMAIDAARSSGSTLIGFLNSSRFNIYTGAWRISE